MMKTTSTVYLPEDLLEDILSRVPAVSLARFRSTSKGWNTLIKDGRFSKKHSAYAPRQYPLVIMLVDFRVYAVSVNPWTPSAEATCQFSLKNPLSNSSLEVDIRNIFPSDGLLLCTTKDNRLVVWNPCSCETRWIQPKTSYKEFDNYALGYDSKSSCYKILRMDHYRTKYQVYDFTSHSWQDFGKIKEYFNIRKDPSRSRGLSLKGNTYWLALGHDGPNFIVSFDFSTNEFRRLPLPEDAPRPYYEVYLSMTRDDQKLCLFTVYGSELFKTDVWIATKMESTGAMSWSKFHRYAHLKIDMRPLSKMLEMSALAEWFLTKKYTKKSVLADHDKKVLVCRHILGYSNNVLHILGKDIYIQVDQHGAIQSTSPSLLIYVPSLVQIQQGI